MDCREQAQKTAAKPLIAGSHIPSVGLVPPSLLPFYPPAHFLCVRHGECRLPNIKENPHGNLFIHPPIPACQGTSDSGRHCESWCHV